MSQWRQDPLTGRWVVVATGRGQRPNEFPPPARPAASGLPCPFCPGHEDLTTPEITARGRDGGGADGPGWRMRVFPNMYPAVGPAADAGAASGEFPSIARPGYGHHEVVVPTTDHDGGLHTLGVAGLTDLLQLVRERVRDLATRPGVAHVLPFFNQGPEAGATLAHPHGQIIAAPLVPDLVATKRGRFDAHAEAGGGCLLCGLLAAEEEAGDRVVATDEGALAVAAWAGRFPYEVLVAPRRHAPDLGAATDDDLAAVSAVLHTALAGLARVAPSPSLNLIVHGLAGDDHFHWHLEVLPRLARLAGFEAGTGFAINAVAPETAAQSLRRQED